LLTFALLNRYLISLPQYREMAGATIKTVERNIRVVPQVYGAFASTLTGYVMSTNSTHTMSSTLP
jgi:hypothetical protein